AALGDQRGVGGREEELVSDVLDELVALGAEADVIATKRLGVLHRRRPDIPWRKRDGDRGAGRPRPGGVSRLVAGVHLHTNRGPRVQLQPQSGSPRVPVLLMG